MKNSAFDKMSEDRFSLEIINKKQKPKPSVIYDTYWRFAASRQDIFIKRFNGELPPWTSDIILKLFKFTNTYRATDRVSQYLIKEVIYGHEHNLVDTFFRILLFKSFNKIETWELLTQELGNITYTNYNFKKYDHVLETAVNRGIAIYSGAYIMASGISSFGHKRKYQNHLKLLEKMIADQVPDKLQSCKSMEGVYLLLLSYPTIGEFLAYQYTIDLNYSSLINFSEMDFVKAGPGAKDGIIKCFEDLGEYSFEDIIVMMCDSQEIDFDRLNLDFKNLWGRRLHLIDCQNIFCEVDKYSRVAHPEINGYSNRVRIKQKFVPRRKKNIDLFFPPKWNINELIRKPYE